MMRAAGQGLPGKFGLWYCHQSHMEKHTVYWPPFCTRHEPLRDASAVISWFTLSTPSEKDVCAMPCIPREACLFRSTLRAFLFPSGTLSSFQDYYSLIHLRGGGLFNFKLIFHLMFLKLFPCPFKKRSGFLFLFN